MRPVRTTIVYFLIYAAFVMLWSFLMYGCSAERLHQKAVNKGYIHTIHVDTFKVATIDTMWRDGKPYPVIKYKDSLVVRTEIKYVPRWLYKFDNERFADSLAHIRAMYEDSLRNARKTQKIKSHEKKIVTKQKTKQTQSENKNGISDLLKWVALSILGIVILVVLFLVIRAVKRHRLING
jgi:hypothetical protein